MIFLIVTFMGGWDSLFGLLGIQKKDTNLRKQLELVSEGEGEGEAVMLVITFGSLLGHSTCQSAAV